MNNLGKKVAQKRKDMGMTQIEFADKLMVTRQTISRWEVGSVMPDIDKISDIARVLNVSCDYLLKDEIDEEKVQSNTSISPLLKKVLGKSVRLTFFEEEIDVDLIGQNCKIVDFEGNWLKVEKNTPKGKIEKLISLSSILSLEIQEEL